MFEPLKSIRRRHKTIYASMAIGILVTVACLLVVQNLAFVHRAEFGAYDNYFSLRQTAEVPRDIVVVGLDATTIRDMANNRYPFPRTPVAKAINYIHSAGAKVIGIDFSYFGKSNYGEKDDSAFERALRQAGNVVLVEQLRGADASNGIAQESGLDVPIARFLRVSAGMGLSNYPQDEDHVIRGEDLLQAGPGGQAGAGKLYPTFPVAIASVLLHKSVSQVVRGLPPHMQINFVGRQEPGSAADFTFHIHQLESVALGEDPASAFRNKIVLIIPAAITTGDIHDTAAGSMYGGYLQANTLNTLLRRNPILPAGDTNNNLIIAATGLLAAIVASRLGIGWSSVTALLLAVGYFILTNVLFQHFRTWANVVTPEIAIVLVYASIMALRFSTEERLKRRLKNSFGLYLKPEIVELMADAPHPEIALAAGRRPISALFVDVRGFTAMSEKMEPEDVVRALDVYLEELTASVQKYDGMINKYVGDEIIGVWNCLSVQPQPDHAMRAIKAGLDMVARMDRLNEQLRAKGLPSIKYGIGINSGEAVVGEMGSSFRKQYDVIGDTMNTAARLCSAAGGGEIIIGQATWETDGDKLIFEETEPLKLKGKSEPIRTFSVLALIPEGETVATAPVPVPTG